MSNNYETPTTTSAVRDYVLGSSTGQNRSTDTVLLNVTHSNLKTTRFAELRMDLRSTIDAVKQRLYLHTGTRPAFMTLLLRAEGGEIRAELSNEAATLADYGARTGDTVHVEDGDAHSASANGWLEDTGLVEKYVLSEEAYDRKEGTYRKYRAKMREKDPTWSMTTSLARRLNARNGERGAVDFGDAEPAVAVGARVEVAPGGKRGVVRFVGRGLTGLPEGWWVGVCYDEPVGRNDGCVKGVRYFEAEMGFGGLVRPSNVSVGDFPPRMDAELAGEEGSEDEI